MIWLLVHYLCLFKNSFLKLRKLGRFESRKIKTNILDKSSVTRLRVLGVKLRAIIQEIGDETPQELTRLTEQVRMILCFI